MCDYSLETFRSRPAQVVERYETLRFTSGTVGFAAPGDPSTAICMACDMRLKLEGIPTAVQTTHGVSADEEVTFVRLGAGWHRDGVRFANGVEVSLQELGAGVTAFLTDALLEPSREPQSADAV